MKLRKHGDGLTVARALFQLTEAGHLSERLKRFPFLHETKHRQIYNEYVKQS